MKTLINKKSAFLVIFFFLFFQQNYCQITYNWHEYYIKTGTNYLDGFLKPNGKTSIISSDRVKFSPLCATCKSEVWVIGLSNNIYSERPESEYYGYIKNKLTNKYLTYDATTGLVSQKNKLSNGSDQSQRWYVGNRFTPDDYYEHRIIPFLDNTKFLNFTTDANGVTNLVVNSTSFSWDIIPTQISAINLENIRGLCPTNHTRGDREFSGHGPHVKLKVTLSMQNDNTEIWANISFSAVETVSDWSTVEGNWDFKVYTTPSGRKLKEIIMDKITTFEENLLNPGGFELFYNSNKTNHNYIDSLSKQFWSPVYEVKIVGDTGGNDISDDNDCNDDTRIEEINFRQLTVIFE
jgi:hypothetical protein